MALALPPHHPLRQAGWFAIVGSLGFVVDASVLYAVLVAGANLYTGRLISYLFAASFTWLLNRRFTFQVGAQPSLREWLAYLAANALGGAFNFGIYAALVATVPAIASRPVIGVAIGSLAGMIINFLGSKYLVFRRSPG